MSILHRDDIKCAPQDVVDERFHRIRGEYHFNFEDAREEEASVEIGTLVNAVLNAKNVCNPQDLMFRVEPDYLALLAERDDIDDEMLNMLHWYAKDVAALVKHTQASGIFDIPSQTH